MMKGFTKKEIVDLIESEIEWSQLNRGDVGAPWSEDFKDGFIVGLKQAKLLVERFAEVLGEK
jgi:hypothetical protein